MADGMKKTNLIFTLVAALLFGAASVGVLSRVEYVILLPLVLPAFSAALSYLFSRVQSVFIMAVPVVSAAMGYFLGTNVFLCIATASFATVAASLFSIVVLKKRDPFQSLMIHVTLYSALWGGIACAFLVGYFGSLTAGFEALGDIFKGVLDEMLTVSGLGDGLSSADRAVMFDAFEDAYLVLPSVFVWGGVVSAWMTKGFLRLICAVNGDTGEIFYAPAKAPRGLAVIFVITAVISSLSDGKTLFYFTVSNLSQALSLLFAFDGIREFVHSFKAEGLRHGRLTLIVLAVYSVVVMPTMLVMIAAWYGAFRAIFRRKVGAQRKV